MSGDRREKENVTAKIIVVGIFCVVMLVLIVLLLRVVITNGSALMRDVGETPIETASPEEEVWVPEVVTPTESAVEEVVAPQYDPGVKDSADFAGDDSGENVPIESTPEQLADATPAPQENLFDPED